MTRTQYSDLQAVIEDPEATQNERDAAAEAIANGTLDLHLCAVLRGYVQRKQQQNRWGR